MPKVVTDAFDEAYRFLLVIKEKVRITCGAGDTTEIG